MAETPGDESSMYGRMIEKLYRERMAIDNAIATARAAEREACAKLADAEADEPSSACPSDVARNIAAAIRSRPDEK